MNVIKNQLTESWLIKAKRDLLAAVQLAECEKPLLDSAAYHCQQAAEKAVKAFLVFQDIRFEKTHDLDVLLNQAAKIEPEFLQLLNLGNLLTPLATEFRYPGEYLEPELDEYEEALHAAKKIFGMVCTQISRKEKVFAVNENLKKN
ncbi:MAG: HEPN domain-containing protein [Deltaproteobacteria bacterium]|nr:HEPN domain-containing protein [Deltaproteobacteria bacterium]